MMRTILIFTLFFTFFFANHRNLHGQVQIDETTLDSTTLISGIDIPWEIIYAPDGWLWMTERFGRISRVHPETGEQDILLDHSAQVSQEGESGMLGMALHPNFPEDARVYVVYTYQDGGMKEKLVYFTYDGSALLDETVLIEGIQGNSTHDGSRLLFAPDGKLLMTTGDAQNLAAPQDLNHLSGKILRLNDDGSIPVDNPFPGSYVYTLGHRNAQGLAFSPGGILYSSEHGPANDDEINIIEAGRNYGWPNVEGYCDTSDEISFCEQNNVAEPIAAWTPTIATSDIIYYNNAAIPEWQGSILLVLLKNKQIIELELSDDGMAITGQKQYFTEFWGRLRDVCAGPNGEVFLATNGSSWLNNEPFTHSIIKLTPPPASGDASPGNTKSPDRASVRQSVNQLQVSSPESLIDSSWAIFDLQGQSLESGMIKSEKTLIAHQLDSGFYLLKLGTENKNAQVHKIFIR